MRDVFIVDGARTGVAKFAGGLASVRPDDMAAHAMKAVMNRNPSVPPEEIGDVILGCANQAGEDNRNVARMSLLLAGLPITVPGETVNRLCASGLSAVVNAGRAIALNDGDLYLAGGVESMTRAPYVLSKTAKPFGRDGALHDTSIGWRFVNKNMEKAYGVDSMGQTAENVAERYAISRDDQDAFALRSQQKATAAREKGRFAREIVPLEIPQRKKPPLVFDQDEFIRPESSLEALAKLRAVFREGGSVTAGNASGINDGSCTLLLASEEACKRYSLKPKARLVASAVVGVEPRVMGLGPIGAVKQLLDKTHLGLDDVDVIELNEAFAAQSLACLRGLGVADDDPRVNPNGGAIAIGHPLGMSGARLALTAVHELMETGKKRAICTMCVGVGQGMAALIERV